MGFGPTGYFMNGAFIPFEKLDNLQRNAYERKTSDIMKQLRTPREVNDTVLRQYLLQASALGMLYTPDGKAVSQADVAKMSENPETMFGFVTDLIVVKPDLGHPENNEYRSLQATNRNISVESRGVNGLLEDQLREKQRTYLEKKQFAAQTEKITAMTAPDRQKYLEDVKTALAKWSENGIEVGSPALKELLETAVEMGIVREVSGSTLTKETAAKIAERPAYLKNLVFIQQSEKDTREFDTYRLDVSDGDPQTVKMHPEKLAEADIVQMDKEMEARGSREKAPGEFAMALATSDISRRAKQQRLMKEFDIKFEYIEGMQAFRLTDEKQVYFFGSRNPIRSVEELMQKTRLSKEPTPPNKWGAFEGLRRFWHNHISKLSDYTEYDKEKAVYELDKYHLAEKAGFDVSSMTDKMKEYEEAYGEEYAKFENVDKYKTARDAKKWGDTIDKWASVFDTRSMNEEEKTFTDDFKAAMKQYPKIGAQIMKHFPTITPEKLDDILFVSQTYADLNRAGDFDKQKLGVLSALGVAAESDIFPSELKKSVFAECKFRNKDFQSLYDQSFLSGKERTQMIAELESGKSAKELENEAQKAAESKKDGKVTSVSDAQVAGDKLRNTIEEEKAVLADKIDGLTVGEKQTFEKLAKQYGLDLESLDVNNVASETANEKAMDVPQVGDM